MTSSLQITNVKKKNLRAFSSLNANVHNMKFSDFTASKNIFVFKSSLPRGYQLGNELKQLTNAGWATIVNW